MKKIHPFTSKSLLRELTKKYKELETAEIPLEKRLELQDHLASKILTLISRVERIHDLERKVFGGSGCTKKLNENKL